MMLQLNTTLGDVVLSYLGGTLLCLTMEMPISALQKLMMPQISTNKMGASSGKSSKTVDFNECTVVNNKQSEMCTQI